MQDGAVPADGEDIEVEFPLEDFPSPQELWQRYKQFRGISDSEEAQALRDIDALAKFCHFRNFVAQNEISFVFCQRFFIFLEVSDEQTDLKNVFYAKNWV